MQWLASRTTHQGALGSSSSWVAVHCGLEQVTFTPCLVLVKDLNSTVAKRGSVFIGLMTPDGAIWFRYQRAVLMR